VLGPSTAVGFASPCDPVESIKVYSLAGAAFVPIAGLVGVKLDAAYMLRVEYLRSGRLRVTRIDEAALGVAWSAGVDSEVNVGKLTTTSGASAKAWVELLLAQGTTYEIAPSDLDEFIVSDILDQVDRPFALTGGISGFGLVKRITKKIVGVADHLPSWKLHDVISGLRKRLNWNPPAPLSTFTEGGLSAGTTGGFGLGFMGQAPLNGKAGITISGRAVLGWERRAGEQIFYLDVRSEIGTPLSYRVFGIDLSKLAAAETKIGVVRNNETGGFDRLEFTIVTENGKNIERRTAVLELTDPTTQPAAQRLIDDLTDPTRLPDSIDAIEKLLGHWVTTERTTLRRMDKSSYGIDVLGTGVKFTVDELDVR